MFTKKSKMRFCVLCILFALLLATIGLTNSNISAKASTDTARWAYVSKKTVYYKGDQYRVTLFKDTAFEEETVLFTATPVYHDGKTDATYVVTIEEKESESLSETLGVSVSTELEAFGNGVHSSLGISSSVVTSYTVSASTGGTMVLSGENEAGFYAVYGSINYVHYKFEVEKYAYKKVGEHQEAYTVNEERKEGCDTVTVPVTKYRTVNDYAWKWEPCPAYSGDFITYANPKEAGSIRLPYKKLG